MQKNTKKKKNTIANSKIVQNTIKEENTETEEQESIEKKAEKEERRKARFTAILAIVAVVGTICTILFKTMSRIMNVWPEKGFVYICIQALFAMTLATCVIILFNIIKYIFYDLNRYDVEDDNYIKYDKESDKAYRSLFMDFKIYVITLIILFLILVIILCIIEELWMLILMLIAVVIFVIAAIRGYKEWKKKKGKEYIKEYTSTIVEKLLVLIGVSFGVYILCLAFVISKSSHVTVDFEEKGIIEIDNQISTGFDGFDIEIYTFEGEYVYSESVETNQLYIARENKYIVNELANDKTTQAVSIDDEKITWKYIINLCELIDIDGKYYIVIKINEGNKRIELLNTFTVEDGKFLYAQDSIDKEY